MSVLIAPSILSADFSKLASEVREVEKGGADWIHVDVMDGHFVPNITMGAVVVQWLRPVTKLPLDCHLMVTHPEKWIENFAQAGANSITIHIEPTGESKARKILQEIRKKGCAAGLSLNPDTPVSDVTPLLDDLDLVLVMSVHPGFSGQKFIPEALKKVEELKKLRGDRKFLIEIDGGIGEKTIGDARKAGCDVFVAGNAVFSKPDRKKAIQSLRASSSS